MKLSLEPNNGGLRFLNRMLLLGIVVWTLLVCGVLVWNLLDSQRLIEHIARESALENIQKDVLYHLWVAEHGGVYVPVTKKTPPDRYLKDVKERDITTPSGRRLTLVNPTDMTRQGHELAKMLGGVKGHITSRRSVVPESQADAWEAKSLVAIESGKKEFGEIVMIDGSPHYRLMLPLFIQESCLKCHAAQGYKLGDLFGGISAAVPMKEFDSISREHRISTVRNLFAIWLLGLAGMLLVTPYIRQRIREREDAVTQLEESEQRTRSIVANAPFGAHIYRLEQDGRFIFIGGNAAAERILSADSSRFIGRTIEEAFPLLSGTDLLNTYRKVVATGRPAEVDNVDYEENAIRGAFEVHAFQAASNHVAVFFRDVTERKKADDALRVSEERFRTIVDTSLEGIITIDDTAVITFTNARMTEILGYAREELLGRSIFDFIHEDEKQEHEKQLALRRQGLATVYDRRFHRKDGSVIWTRASASPLFDARGEYNGAFGMYSDVTERKRAEEELRDNEEQLRIIFEASQAGIILVGPQGMILYANQRMADMFRCTLPELIGSTYPDHLHPVERTTGDERMRRLIRGDIQAVNTERHYIRKDGSDFWGYLSGRRMENPDGSLRALVGIIADITERKQAEEALRDSENRYRTLFTRAGDGIFILSGDGSLIEVNEAFARMHGYRTEEMLHMNLKDLDTPESAQRAPERMRRIFNGESLTFEVEHYHKDGHVFPLEVSASRISYGGNTFIQCFHRDITDRKQVEEALRRSEEQFRLLLNSTGEAIYGIDGAGTCTFCNPACVRLLGHRNQDELLGRNMHEIMHHTRKDGTPYPLHECKVVGTIEHGTGAHVIDEIFWRADGKSFPVEYWSYPQMRDGRIVGAVVTFVDITDRMKVEENFRQAKKMEAIGTLAGGIAHDFNNIMMAIMGYAHLLKIGPSSDPQNEMAVDEIIAAAERAAQLTQGLLAFSRKQVMRRSILDLNEVIRSFRNMIGRLLREDIELHMELARDSVVIDADRGQVEQVLMNLFTNARDSMPKGGRIFITTGVTEIGSGETDRYYVPEPGAYAYITMSDTGQGMDEDTLSHIFEPFFTTKEVGKGTGLGLSMVYGIIKKHNGSVLVSSKPGQGTIVSLYIPLAHAKPAASSEPREKGRLTGNELVLVVEDDEAVRSVVRDILARYGYTILEAGDGKHAEELFREKEKDVRLVISDMVMPNKSGWELFQELKEVKPGVKFLFLSGYDRSMALDQESGSEEVHFLQKPLKPHELLAKVREILDAPG